MNSENHREAGDVMKTLWTMEEPPERTSVEDLRREVERRRRRMLMTVAGELVLTLGLIAVSMGLLADGSGSPQRLTSVGLLWVTWLVAAGFATWNRWGVWRPSGETALGYLALSEERARRRRRVADFVLGLVFLQLVMFSFFGAMEWVGLALVALYVGWAVWYRRRAGRELAELRRIASEFRTGDQAV